MADCQSVCIPDEAQSYGSVRRHDASVDSGADGRSFRRWRGLSVPAIESVQSIVWLIFVIFRPTSASN